MRLTGNTKPNRFSVYFAEGTLTCNICEGEGTRRFPSRKHKGRYRIVDCSKCKAEGTLPIQRKKDRLTKAQADKLIASLAERGIKGSLAESAGYLTL